MHDVSQNHAPAPAAETPYPFKKEGSAVPVRCEPMKSTGLTKFRSNIISRPNRLCRANILRISHCPMCYFLVQIRRPVYGLRAAYRTIPSLAVLDTTMSFAEYVYDMFCVFDQSPLYVVGLLWDITFINQY